LLYVGYILKLKSFAYEGRCFNNRKFRRGLSSRDPKRGDSFICVITGMLMYSDILFYFAAVFLMQFNDLEVIIRPKKPISDSFYSMSIV
jgi:hypothetical protein